MDMTGEYRIPAPREKVWEALNDPDTLAKCIPGCQELNKDSDTELSAKVKTKVGPVSATFSGKVTLSDINPPQGYTITGEGTGGAAGFAKGGAEVELEEDGAETILRYTAKAQVGGKLAQIGSRLIDSTAKKMAGQFFDKFAEEVGGAGADAEGSVTAEADTEGERAPRPVPEAPLGSDDGAPGPESKPKSVGAAAAPQASEPQSSAPETPASKPAASGGISPVVWIGGLVAVVVVLLIVFS